MAVALTLSQKPHVLKIFSFLNDRGKCEFSQASKEIEDHTFNELMDRAEEVCEARAIEAAEREREYQELLELRRGKIEARAAINIWRLWLGRPALASSSSSEDSDR